MDCGLILGGVFAFYCGGRKGERERAGCGKIGNEDEENDNRNID